MRVPALLLASILLACDVGPELPPGTMRLETREATSPTFHITKIYRSMEGPAASAPFALSTGPRQLVWVTGFRTEIVDRDGEPGDGLREFMGHSQLDFDPLLHGRVFGVEREIRTGRIFDASQGVFEVTFPVGYGIPVLSDEPFSIATQVLNHNQSAPNLTVRQRVRVEYVPDEYARESFRSLYPAAVPVMALVSGDDGYYQVEEPEGAQSAAESAPGQPAPHATAPLREFSDEHGRVFTQHWALPPGREERHTLATDLLSLPFDTAIHTVTAHLHPFAESISLRDLTTGETVVSLQAEAAPEGVGIASVRGYSSSNGIPLFRDHEYEVVSVYDNTSPVDQDAMAVLYLYYRDSEMDEKVDAVRARLEGR